MPPTEEDVAPYAVGFISMLNAAFNRRFALFSPVRNRASPNPGRAAARPEVARRRVGLVDEAAPGVAGWSGGALAGHGGQTVIRRLARAFARWAEPGLPGPGDFGLEVWRARAAPAGTVW